MIAAERTDASMMQCHWYSSMHWIRLVCETAALHQHSAMHACMHACVRAAREVRMIMEIIQAWQYHGRAPPAAAAAATPRRTACRHGLHHPAQTAPLHAATPSPAHMSTTTSPCMMPLFKVFLGLLAPLCLAIYCFLQDMNRALMMTWRVTVTAKAAEQCMPARWWRHRQGQRCFRSP